MKKKFARGGGGGGKGLEKGPQARSYGSGSKERVNVDVDVDVDDGAFQLGNWRGGDSNEKNKEENQDEGARYKFNFISK